MEDICVNKIKRNIRKRVHERIFPSKQKNIHSKYTSIFHLRINRNHTGCKYNEYAF